MRIFLISFLFFLYLYPFSFSGTYLNTRHLIVLSTSFFLVLSIILKNKSFFISLSVNKKLATIFFSLTLISLSSIISIIYNDNIDLEFIKFPLSIIIIYVSAYLIIQLISKDNKRLSEKAIIKFLIYAVLLQSVLSLTLFFFQDFQNEVYKIISTDNLKLEAINRTSQYRVIGFGRSFFGAGIYSGAALILAAHLFKYYNISAIEGFWLSFISILIFLIGMMMSRTTIIGALIGFIIILIPNKKSFKGISKEKLKYTIALITTLALIIFIVLLSPFKERLYVLSSFGFELFINMFSHGKLETSSTNALFDMFIFPDTLKTWIIGDAHWSENNGMSYYMNTDVGYSRLLFYFGVTGLFSMLLFQYLTIRLSIKENVTNLFLIFYIIILNVKGFTEITPFLAIILLHKIYNNKLKNFGSNENEK